MADDGKILIGFIKVYFRNTCISNLRHIYTSVAISFILLAYFSIGVNNLTTTNIYCALTICQCVFRKRAAFKGFFSVGCLKIGLLSIWRDQVLNEFILSFFSCCAKNVSGTQIRYFVGDKAKQNTGPDLAEYLLSPTLSERACGRCRMR